MLIWFGFWLVDVVWGGSIVVGFGVVFGFGVCVWVGYGGFLVVCCVGWCLGCGDFVLGGRSSGLGLGSLGGFVYVLCARWCLDLGLLGVLQA